MAASGAVADQCTHRRMKLSLGSVQQGRLICPYHGWSFTHEGAGESPSAPKMHACITSYDCAEAFGVIWVKGAQAASRRSRIVGEKAGDSSARSLTKCARRFSS